MRLSIAWVCCVTLLSLTPSERSAQAEPQAETVVTRSGPFGLMGTRQRLGYGRLTTNDLFGDGDDRWRTGSLMTSRVWGYRWDGRAPDRIGDVLELRLFGQIITPEDLTDVDPEDRPWAGALSVGLHTHFMAGETELALGGDLVVIGPQTRLDQFQRSLHDLIGVTEPSADVLDNQIGNRFRPTLVVEAGRTFSGDSAFRFRPFVEGRAGDETLIRAGADLTLGNMGLGELLVRSPISGHRVRTIRVDRRGTSLVMGADIGHVFDSVYLPEDRGIKLEETRRRARLGFQYQNKGTGLFYGVTWLDEEFQGQRESQLIGSLKIDYRW